MGQNSRDQLSRLTTEIWGAVVDVKSRDTCNLPEGGKSVGSRKELNGARFKTMFWQGFWHSAQPLKPSLTYFSLCFANSFVKNVRNGAGSVSCQESGLRARCNSQGALIIPENTACILKINPATEDGDLPQIFFSWITVQTEEGGSFL